MRQVRVLVSAAAFLVAVFFIPATSANPSGGGEEPDRPFHAFDNAVPAATGEPPVQNRGLEARQDANSFDIIIVGGTPGGITTALSASRVLNDVQKPVKILILERTTHIGGLPANGLGATDIKTRDSTQGMFREFVDRIKEVYKTRYGAGSKQLSDSSNGFHFEASVAEKVLTDMISEEKGRVVVKLQKQFDAKPEDVDFDAATGRIKSLVVTDVKTKARERYTGKYFIDATYEGDLVAAAKVPFFLGRESDTVYTLNGKPETGAGKVYKYWGGAESTGTTHQGDDTTQAFNYRMCLTNNATNMVPFPKPANYNPSEYMSLIKDIVTSCYSSPSADKYCRRDLPAGDAWMTTPPTDYAPNHPKGINRLTNMVTLPNGKTDANNQHLVFISTDLPEENWKYPTADWAWRDNFAKRLREYTLGLFWFAQNDPAVPVWYRNQLKGWGMAKDEYTDNQNFPRQVYVRQGRRMKGTYIFTAHDALTNTLKWDSVTAAHYALDSHAVRKREPNRAHLDGFISYTVPKPYTVPMGVMVPTRRTDGVQIHNLLAPVPASSSHIGYSTLRMEPCWMALGQAAGMVFGLFLKDNYAGAGTVTKIDIRRVQNALLDRGAVLVYSSDLAGKTIAEKKAIQQAALKKARDSEG